jgi:gamma-glutamylcyclotransferase (GGCT)/AIG2-like uncharacterized protein YtfP
MEVSPAYLFVYGTLRRDAATEWSRFLGSASRFVGMGRTRGALFQLNGYPGMATNTHDDDWVLGEVCLLNKPPSLLATLDGYEGCGPADPLPHEYERRVVEVLLETGETIRAWAYLYSLDTAGKVRIRSGDYLRPAES